MEKQVLYCKCQGDIIDENISKQVEEILPKAKANVFITQDLCGLCALEPETLQKTIDPAQNILLLACHQRSISALFQFAKLKDKLNKIELVDLLENDTETIKNKIDQFAGLSNKSTSPTLLQPASDWPAWYPVLDYDRCVNCGQCADFCLFGTYTKQDDTVLVSLPQSCKNNCPACARICPEAAIIFPKYTEGGAISGSNTINEKLEHERVQQDIEQILGGDIYEALEKRKNKRRRLIKQESMNKAIEERENALKKTDYKQLGFNPFGKE